ncbi:hypothetical protein [Methylocucumis oryzae]|uniref:DUF551 domain-containing protein n=1 Tax=Methylocucumis oryzae TaxID=1632867 RepID=A0A0F3IMT2_9GAMM|nr:hypothetical protein [Methylocucumis oryzae]KJV08021.1 hypothetical protein VZ94_01010 [Methylocucumis oryzae]
MNKLEDFENPNNWTRPYNHKGDLLAEHCLYKPKLKANTEFRDLLSMSWIDAKKETPKILNSVNHSDNVWGWDGHNIMVVAYFIDEDGGHWANAYGNVWGDAEFDDDYDIKAWQPIEIPLPPNNNSLFGK